jgi:hypothetical protein
MELTPEELYRRALTAFDRREREFSQLRLNEWNLRAKRLAHLLMDFLEITEGEAQSLITAPKLEQLGGVNPTAPVGLVTFFLHYTADGVAKLHASVHCETCGKALVEKIVPRPYALGALLAEPKLECCGQRADFRLLAGMESAP